MTTSSLFNIITVCQNVQVAGATAEVFLPLIETKSLTAEVQGISADTVVLEGSLDGESWHTLHTFTANGLAGGVLYAPRVRVNVTTYSGGDITLKVRLAGLYRN